MSLPFRFCPSCTAPTAHAVADREFRCDSCGFRLFQNVATACGVLVRYNHRNLFLVRAKEPSRGKLGLVGGFVDPGESAEQALAREVREEIGAEIGITIGQPRFVVSFPNRYEFAGVTYHTCDLYFRAELLGSPQDLTTDPGEVERLVWLSDREVRADDLAFESLRRLWSSLSVETVSQ